MEKDNSISIPSDGNYRIGGKNHRVSFAPRREVTGVPRYDVFVSGKYCGTVAAPDSFGGRAVVESPERI